MTKSEFLKRIENEKPFIGSYQIKVDFLTKTPNVLGCYKNNSTWEIYETYERGEHCIISENQDENLIFDEFYDLIKSQEKLNRSEKMS